MTALLLIASFSIAFAYALWGANRAWRMMGWAISGMMMALALIARYGR